MESNDYKVEKQYDESIVKKQLIIFFLIAFAFNFLMGIGIYIGKEKGVDVNSFANFQMMTPALGTIVAMWATTKESELIPKFAFGAFIITAILMAIGAWMHIFNPNFPAAIVSNVLIMLGSVLFLLGLLIAGKEKRAAYGLSLGNIGKILLMLGLFIALYFIRMLAVTVPTEGMDTFLGYFGPEDIVMVLTIILNTFLTFLAFFGEEYGWRYFLQTIFQKRIGMVKGLLLVGLLWGLWHLPLNLFYYSAEGTGLLSLINQIILCISYTMMFGFAYSYSGSVWTPVLLHYFNNNMILIFASLEDLMNPDLLQNQEYSWEIVGIMAVANLILFGIFAFAKRNRKEEYRIPTPNERLINIIEESNLNKEEDGIKDERL